MWIKAKNGIVRSNSLCYCALRRLKMSVLTWGITFPVPVKKTPQNIIAVAYKGDFVANYFVEVPSLQFPKN